MNPVTGLSLGRIVIGVGGLADPNLVGKLFRLDVESNPQLPLMTRMFAAREIALGVVTLATRGTGRRRVIALGMAVDGADAYAGTSAVTSGSVPKSVGAGFVIPAALAIAAGAVGLATSGKTQTPTD